MAFRSALRSLRANLGFTALAILVLALGIGANTAIFSVVDAVMLRPLHYRDPGRIVMVGSAWRGSKVALGNLSQPDFDDLHDGNTVFESFATYSGGGLDSAVIVGKSAEFASLSVVSPDFFRVFETAPASGRLFSPEEDAQGEALVAVIGDSFWKRRFGGSSNAIGGTLRANGKVYTVIGVMPSGFSFPGASDVWIPSPVTGRNSSRSAHNFNAIARLRPEATLESAQSQLTTIGVRLEQAYPLSNKRKSFRVIGLQEQLVSDVKTTLFLLLGAVALVLLIACANVANLLLARAASRSREIALRAAIGASRRQIAGQLVAESCVVALVASAAGLCFAWWGVNALLALSPDKLLNTTQVHIDVRVLGFTLLLAAATSILCGLAPAWRASKVELTVALKQGASRGTTGSAGRLRAALVVAEIAISVVLLVGAGLLIRSFAALATVNWGFRPENLLVVQANAASSGLEQSKRVTQLYTEILSQAASIPGVVSAAGAYGVPGGARSSWGGYSLEGGPGYDQLGMSIPQADFIVSAPEYFRTMGISIKAGRDFSPRDQYDADFTAIINESLARQSFPHENPLGRRIKCGLDSPKFMTIVGVVADTRATDPAIPPRPAIFMPYLQHPYYGRRMSFVLKTQADPLAVSEALRRKVAAIDSEIPVSFTTMETRIAGTVASPKFRGLLFGAFAALAICLAMAGIYAVMSYVVTQRTSEIGVRMALGAGQGGIVNLVLAQGLKLAALGLILGFAGAAAATRSLKSMLYGVHAADPATYLFMALAVTAVCVLACAIPAWRATRVDPLAALRQE